MTVTTDPATANLDDAPLASKPSISEQPSISSTRPSDSTTKHRFDARYSIDVGRFTERGDELNGYQYQDETQGDEDEGESLFSQRGEDDGEAEPSGMGIGAGPVDPAEGEVVRPVDIPDVDNDNDAPRPSIVTPFHDDYAPKTEQLQQQQQQQQQRLLETVTAAAASAQAAQQNGGVPEEGRPEEKKKGGFFSRLLGKDKKSTPSWQQSNIVPVKAKRKSNLELSHLSLLQTVGQHVGAIWCFAWSLCGQLLATGGQDGTVIVWAAMGSPYAQEVNGRLGGGGSAPEALAIGCPAGGRPVLHPVPYAVFCGHKADVIDLSWSRGNFLLSGSIDKTARLWHLSKPKCLMVFQHTDFVTAVCFHPIEDRYFLSGSFDRKLRVWNIPHHKVVEWTRTPAIVTSACFSPDGYTAVAGLYQGQVMLYHTEQLRYKTQLDCRNRSGKDSGGRKVTGVVFSEDGLFLLVSTNDSRLRLYSMDDYRMVSKYKGLQNKELQIKAHLGPGYTRIISGSEDGNVYLWDASTDDRKDNHIDSYEYFNGTYSSELPTSASGASKESTMVTCADFVPFPVVRGCSGDDAYRITHMIITADANGDMRIFENTLPPTQGPGK